MTLEDVMQNLKQLIGTEFDENEVICAFEDFEEDRESSVYVGDSHNSGYDKIAYIDTTNSTQFLFSLDNDGIITNVFSFDVIEQDRDMSENYEEPEDENEL